jgi:hypothetical protein
LVSAACWAAFISINAISDDLGNFTGAFFITDCNSAIIMVAIVTRDIFIDGCAIPFALSVYLHAERAAQTYAKTKITARAEKTLWHFAALTRLGWRIRIGLSRRT